MNQFEVEGILGRGAFAQVYRVRRKADGQAYALKCVRVNSLTPKELRDTLNEIRLIASLKHDNVVGFYDSFLESPNKLCIVMEFCEGGDLAQVIQKQKRMRRLIKEKRILGYAQQIARGLEYLHGRSVLHRDLKPGNCFLRPSNQLKLGDFNVSTILKGEALAKTQIGTPYYMSPEVWKEKPYDSKCDIWSFGILLYELACLRPPFDGHSLSELKKTILRGQYRRINSAYSPQFCSLVREMLRVNPGSRPTPKSILQNPIFEALDGPSDRSEAPAASAAPEDLLRTIKVRHRFDVDSISRQLPKPCYRDLKPVAETPATTAEAPIPVRGSLAAVRDRPSLPVLPGIPRPPLQRPRVAPPRRCLRS